HAPAGTWRYISAGDGAFEICAVAATGLATGLVSCWTSTGGEPLPGGGNTGDRRFKTLSASDYGTCGVTIDNSASCFGGAALPADFVGRSFGQVVTANQMVYGLDDSGALHGPSFVLPAYPAGRYKQLIANNAASCALREDGAFFCNPPAATLPPPSETGFLEIA